MTVYANPGTEGSKVEFKKRYEHFIGGEWVAPKKGQYFENPTPVTGKTFCEVGRGTAEDIEAALDAGDDLLELELAQPRVLDFLPRARRRDRRLLATTHRVRRDPFR